jgi:hypothetical protein
LVLWNGSFELCLECREKFLGSRMALILWVLAFGGVAEGVGGVMVLWALIMGS